MSDKRTKSKGVLSYKKKKRSKNTLSKKVSKKRRSSKKQRTIEKQRKIIAKQSLIISKQRKTLKKQRKKLSKSLNGGGGTRRKKKKKTRAQQQRERIRRLKREEKQEEELRQQELREEPSSGIEWRWKQEVLDPVITQATPEEIERTREAYAKPPLSEKWKKLQTGVRSKSPEIFSQQQAEEPEVSGSEVDTDEELEGILQETDELLREQQEEEQKEGISPFAQSSTVETGYESQEREPEIETEVATGFTSPALRLDVPSSSESEYESEYESDVTQEGDPSGFTPFGQYSETEADPNDSSIFTSGELPLAQQSETDSEGELTRGFSTEVRLPSNWEKEQEELEEQKQSGFLSGFKTKFSEATQRKPVEPGLFPTQEEEEEESEDEGELTTFAQPLGLTAPKKPTDIPSFEPSDPSTQKPATYSSEKPGKFASAFKKVKSVFSSPDYEELLKSNAQELKDLYIAYLDEHFDDIKEGEDIDTIKQNYLSFVEQYYKEALKKDKLLLEKLKDA